MITGAVDRICQHVGNNAITAAVAQRNTFGELNVHMSMAPNGHLRERGKEIFSIGKKKSHYLREYGNRHCATMRLHLSLIHI